jgi:hypothetical protein
MGRNGRAPGTAIGALAVAGILLVGIVPAGAASDVGSAKSWKRHAHLTPEGEGFVVFETPSGFGAVALVGRDATLYASSDGKRWKRTTQPAAFAEPMGIAEAATGNDQIVLAGSSGPEGQEARAFWFSKDGKRWTRRLGDPAVFGDPGSDVFVNGITWGKRQWVAVGADGLGAVLVPAVWTSKNGRTWTRAPSGGALTTTDTTFFREVAYGGGRFVAVGVERDTSPAQSTYDEAPAVFTSRDGERWSRTNLPAAPAEVARTTAVNPSVVRRIGADGVVYAAGRFVLWGDGTDALSQGSVTRTPFVVASRTGTSGWSGDVLPGSSATTNEVWNVTDVAGRGKTLVAVGYHSQPNVKGAAAIWVSTNAGRTWKLLRGRAFDLPPGLTFGGPSNVEVTKTGVLATGVPEGSGESDRVAWVNGSP